MAPAKTADHVLGRKLDSIPFSAYHVLLIVVLGTVGFVEGYDLALGGSLIVLAREPLHLSQSDTRWLLPRRRSWLSSVALPPRHCPTG